LQENETKKIAQLASENLVRLWFDTFVLLLTLSRHSIGELYHLSTLISSRIFNRVRSRIFG
jgi:hypothetical protein